MDLEPFIDRIAGVWAPDLPSVRARVRALLEEVTIATVREYAGAVSELVEAAAGGTAIGRWERRTVTVALRLFQSEHLQSLSFEPVPPQPARLHTFKREDPPLSSAEIDALCDRLEAPAAAPPTLCPGEDQRDNAAPAPVRSLFDVDLEAYERAPRPLPKRSHAELAAALRVRADSLGGAHWEVPATIAMMREAADALEEQARRPAGFR